MIDHTWAALILLLAPTALAGGNSDAVNERIPVTKSEMEEHWQVNCAGAWAELRALTADPVVTGNCSISTELIHEIQLCGFIYQAPGEKNRSRCPDYRNASRLLEQIGESTQCSTVLHSIGKQIDCQSTVN